MERRIPVGVILAAAGYGKGTQFRTALRELGLQYIVGIESNASLGAWTTAPAGPKAETRLRSASQTFTPRPRPATAFGAAISVGSARCNMEEHRLAPRESRSLALAFCRRAGPSCPSR